MRSTHEGSDLIESLGRLGATMAHEFNNVLMSVLQAGEMIERFYPHDARLARLADQLFNATSRGRRVTDEVLQFSNPPQAAIKPFDALKWLAVRIPEIESLVAGRGVRLHFEVPQTEVTVSGDPDQLHHALVSLVKNACDAMPMGGDLTIGLVQSDQNVQLWFADTGMGMPPETMRQIFEPLFTTKRNGKGLGLAVVHQVVTASGGTIEVESQPGAGTTFHVVLPCSSGS